MCCTSDAPALLLPAAQNGAHSAGLSLHWWSTWFFNLFSQLTFAGSLRERKKKKNICECSRFCCRFRPDCRRQEVNNLNMIIITKSWCSPAAYRYKPIHRQSETPLISMNGCMDIIRICQNLLHDISFCWQPPHVVDRDYGIPTK